MWINLRSDTVTHPTEAMRHAMANAEVGDKCHILMHEVGAAAVLSGLQTRTFQ